MHRDLLQVLNDHLKPAILGYYSENNGGDFCVTNKKQTKYRGLGEKQWYRWVISEPNSDNRCLEPATSDQVTSEVFNRVLSEEDPKYPEVIARKNRIKEALGDTYHLGYVDTMLGSWLPVISKTPAGSKEDVAIAHLFPGEQTDALDAAPKKDIATFFEISEQDLYSWLTWIASETDEKVLNAIKQAIVTLDRPEKFIPHYRS